MNSKPSKEKQRRLAMRMWSVPSVEKMTLLRNAAFGAGAITLALIIALTQVSERSLAFKVTAVAGSLAMPAWFVMGTMFESFIMLGKRSYPFLRTRSSMFILLNTMMFAAISTFVSLSCLLWILTPYATIAFITVTVLAHLVSFRFSALQSAWWYEEGGPGESEPDYFAVMFEADKGGKNRAKASDGSK